MLFVPPCKSLMSLIRFTGALSNNCDPPAIVKDVRKHSNSIINEKVNTCNNCDCRVKADCPLNGHCKTNGVIYQATITTETSEQHTYTGLSSNSFKERWVQHCSDFRNLGPKPKTTLCKKVWDLKRQNIQFDVTWSLKQKAFAYSPGAASCNLCISEVYHILYKPEGATLNSRNELKNKCLHMEKFKLSNHKT